MIIGIILGYFLFNSKPVAPIIEQKILYDTIYNEIPAEPIIIEKIRAEKEYIHDTIIVTKPFIAKADTIIQKDTVVMFYTFPENYFSMQYKTHRDSIAIPTQTIIKTELRKRELWEIPAAILSGCAIGILINN